MRPTSGDFVIASWNVEGLSDAKLIQLQRVMVSRNIKVLCLQETHVAKSEYRVTEEGFLLIQSGRQDDERESAGVGFLVAPDVRRSVIGFCQMSRRIAYVKLRVKGGKAVVFTAYAPHNGRPFDERQAFYSELQEAYHSTSCHGLKVICGDLNARLHKRLPGEEVHMGEFMYGNPNATLRPGSNRDLLMEACVSLDLVIANTLHEVPPREQVTFFAVGAAHDSELTPQNFATLDYILLPRVLQQCVGPVRSDVGAALGSHHFLIQATLAMTVAPTLAKQRPSKRDVAALKRPDVAKDFSEAFAEELASRPRADNVNAASQAMCDAFAHAAQKALPECSGAQPHRPWVRAATLQLIDQRTAARADHDVGLERDLARRIRASVRSDRRAWLDEVVAQKDWAQVRKLRRGTPTTQGRLKDAAGRLVSSELRAETMADHLEKVQWAVRPASVAPDRPPLGQELPVDLGPFAKQELVTAARAMKHGRASGMDGIPAEFWQAVVVNGPGCEWALEFCNIIWDRKEIPDDWRTARVATLYKKGDPALCDNYRPISLLAVGYRLFAAMLLRRLKRAGAEQCVWSTQCGFKSGTGTVDALFMARRILEGAWAEKGGSAVLLALDWAKAFDSIRPEALLTALRRFGVPEPFSDMVRNIYENRTFLVQDAGARSRLHPQHAGVCQGCPLSPFLFVIIMTVLIHDARAELRERSGKQPHNERLGEILYADDTLLVDTHGGVAEEYMRCVAEVGLEYGLALNPGKTEVLCCRCNDKVRSPDGAGVKQKESMMYLGASLSADGRVDSEVARRIGAARADFRALQRVWAHASLAVKDKVRIYDACVVSSLTYGLQTAWLSVAARRRLDGFHAKCLRRICNILPSFISRVPNAEVLARAGCSVKLSTRIRVQQLVLAGRCAAAPVGTPMREALQQSVGRPGRRNRGRPRTTWAADVFAEAVAMAGSADLLQAAAANPAEWRRQVVQHCARTYES